MSEDIVDIARGSHGEAWYADEIMKVPRLLQHVLADEITRLRAALATARREGMEEAAKIATEFEIVAHLHGPWSDVGHECAAQAAGIVAAAIRAAAGEVKP
jgi:hypothetical protein